MYYFASPFEDFLSCTALQNFGYVKENKSMAIESLNCGNLKKEIRLTFFEKNNFRDYFVCINFYVISG